MTSQLVVKLKMPEKEQLFDCPICQRSFTNGKALGAHKRVHMRRGSPNRSNQHNELQIANLEAEGDQERRTFLCPVCSQGFVSARSVHGHMRKHPERNWRGMIPPPPIPRVENPQPLALEGPQYHSDHHQPKLLTLPGWLRTGTRKSSRRHGKAPRNDDNNPEQSMSKKKKLDHSDPVPKSLVIKGKELLPAVRGRHKPRYACTVCDRSFKNYQALGGHKSHHVRIIRSTEDGQDSVGIASGAIVPYIGQPSCTSQLVDHGCRFCRQILLTGEALGEHMQQCCGTATGNEVIPCNGGEQETKKQIRGFRFDLNELPPEWTE